MIGGSGTTLGDVRDAVLPISQRSGEMGSQRVAVQKGSGAKKATLERELRDAVLPISQRSGEMGSQRVAVQEGSLAKEVAYKIK